MAKTALGLNLLLGVVAPVFAQDAQQHDRIAIFVGPAWARIPDSSGFFGSNTPAENHFALVSGFEALPFAHLGFQFSMLNMKRDVHLVSVFSATPAQSSDGETFISGDAVFHMLIRKRFSPFLSLGVAEDGGSTTTNSATGLNAAVGGWLRISPHVALRPEARVYVVHILGNSDPAVLSVGVIWHR